MAALIPAYEKTDFLFLSGELKMNDPYLKKLRTDSSSESETPQKKFGCLVPNRVVQTSDPAFQIPFKYGWKRELVSFNLLSESN